MATESLSPHLWGLATAVYYLSLAALLAAQAAVIDDPVRITVRNDAREQQILGRLTSVGPESLTIRLAKGDSLLTIDRHTIQRVERKRRAWRFRTTMTVGCLTLGGALALLGSQAHDPDSPGIERAFAVAGFGLGCAVGALGGALAAWVSPGVWEEISI